ncbi:hypothetical protein BGZ58_004229 [Dissophora ornata]|nr:hypothetical protein BGZ58_004229 [Dissophora ornata]
MSSPERVATTNPATSAGFDRLFAANGTERKQAMERPMVYAQRELDSAIRHRDRSIRESENCRLEQTQQIQEELLVRAPRRQQAAETCQVKELGRQQAAEAVQERRRQAAEAHQAE